MHDIRLTFYFFSSSCHIILLLLTGKLVRAIERLYFFQRIYIVIYILEKKKIVCIAYLSRTQTHNIVMAGNRTFN